MDGFGPDLQAEGKGMILPGVWTLNPPKATGLRGSQPAWGVAPARGGVMLYMPIGLDQNARSVH